MAVIFFSLNTDSMHTRTTVIMFHLYLNLHVLTAANTVSGGHWPTILLFPFPLTGPRLTGSNLGPGSVKLHCVSVCDEATDCAEASPALKDYLW
jgi:hypothetical protein